MRLSNPLRAPNATRVWHNSRPLPNRVPPWRRRGMGEVYRARDTRLDRTDAIKVLPEHVATDPDLKQRFEC